MDDYKVDIRFPKQGDDSIVIISGDEDAVLDAKDHLLNLAEEYVRIFMKVLKVLFFAKNFKCHRIFLYGSSAFMDRLFLTS